MARAYSPVHRPHSRLPEQVWHPEGVCPARPQPRSPEVFRWPPAVAQSAHGCGVPPPGVPLWHGWCPCRGHTTPGTSELGPSTAPAPSRCPPARRAHSHATRVTAGGQMGGWVARQILAPRMRAALVSCCPAGCACRPSQPSLLHPRCWLPEEATGHSEPRRAGPHLRLPSLSCTPNMPSEQEWLRQLPSPSVLSTSWGVQPGTELITPSCRPRPAG